MSAFPPVEMLEETRVRRRVDVVEPRAIAPEDLAAYLVAERQPEELLHCLRERAVRVRVVGRDDEIVGAHLVDDVDRRLLVDVERDVALTLEILARQHRKLMLAPRPELLPLVVEPPEPPVEPAGRALEERAAQPGMALEDTARGHAGDRAHQLDRIADGVGDRVEVGVADVAPAGVVLERGIAGRMESDRDVELLERAPERLARFVVQVLPADRVRRADDADGAELPDASPRRSRCTASRRRSTRRGDASGSSAPSASSARRTRSAGSTCTTKRASRSGARSRSSTSRSDSIRPAIPRSRTTPAGATSATPTSTRSPTPSAIRSS